MKYRITTAITVVLLSYGTLAHCLTVLDNGLQIVVKENHTAPVATVRIYVKTGSIYEQEYLGTGISHIFEHLINGGTTTTYSEAKINELIDRLGGANNAYTTRGHTGYYINTAADQIGDAINLISDWMINCTFPENEFSREIGVVLEELKKGREEPIRVLQKSLYETMYSVHPARYPVIGYENLIRSVTRDDILEYYKRMYVPNNMVVVAVGDFDKDDVIAQITAAFRHFERRPLPALSLPAEPRQLGERKRTLRKAGLGQAYFTVAYRTIPIDHPDLYALDVLSFILSHGRSSRLVQALREEKRLVSTIYSYSLTPDYDAGIFAISGICRDKNVDDVLVAIEEEIAIASSELVANDELNKAIKQKIADDVLGSQTAEAEADELGINLVTTGNPDFNDVYLNGIRKVIPNDIRNAAQNYLRKQNRTVVLLRPDIVAATATDIISSSNSSPIEKVVLPNKCRLLVKRNPNVPLVNIQVRFLGGTIYEPATKAGLSRITADMLTRGTQNRSRHEIAAAFDAIGGRYTGSSGNNTFGLEVEVLREDFDFAIKIVAEMLKHPSFDGDEFTTVRQNSLDAIARRTDRWDSEISYLFKQQFFGSHPYANDSLGDRKSIESITVTDIRDYYRRFVVPDRCVITVFGDIDTQKVSNTVDHLFSGFNPSPATLPSIAPQIPLTENRTVVEDTGKNISAVFMGYPGTTINNSADRFPLIILDTILSGYGYPGGWLHNHLRGQDKNLVYLVHGYNFVGIDPGYFGILAASSPENLDEVIKIILHDIETIKSDPVTANELSTAKIICNTMESLSRQTNSEMAIQAAVDELYGLGYDFSDKFRIKINAVTAEDVSRVAKKYLTQHLIVRTNGKTEIR